jgi:hypothetical protein
LVASVASFKGVESLFELLQDRRFGFAGKREPFPAQMASLLLGPSGELWIQAAVIFDYSPVRSQSLTAVGTILFRSLSSDPHKDSGC